MNHFIINQADYFTEKEAGEKSGLCVQLLQDYQDLKAGTIGTIFKAFDPTILEGVTYENNEDEVFALVINFTGNRNLAFTKPEYEKVLVETGWKIIEGHLIPLNDIQEHQKNNNCWCNPSLLAKETNSYFDIVAIHNGGLCNRCVCDTRSH